MWSKHSVLTEVRDLDTSSGVYILYLIFNVLLYIVFFHCHFVRLRCKILLFYFYYYVTIFYQASHQEQSLPYSVCLKKVYSHFHVCLILNVSKTSQKNNVIILQYGK